MMIVLIHVIRVFYVHYQSHAEGSFEEGKSEESFLSSSENPIQDEGKSLLGAREFYFQILVDFIWIFFCLFFSLPLAGWNSFERRKRKKNQISEGMS